MACSSDESFDPAKRKDILRKFAPVVYFHPQEKYFPDTVERYLQNVRLRLDIKGGRDKGIRDRVGKVGNLLKHHERCQHSDGTYPSRYFLEIRKSGKKTTRAGCYEKAKCYARIRRAPHCNYKWDILYVFFFPYNGNLSVGGAHEGDWEHITIRVDDDAENIEKIYYSAHHHEGKWIYSHGQDNKDGFKLEKDEIVPIATHPIVYSAKDSHASYPSPGRKARSMIDLTSNGLADFLGDWLPDDDCGGEGSNFTPWFCYKNIQDITNPKPAWLKYSGLWGEKGKFDGPPGPAFQYWWYNDDDCCLEFESSIRFLSRNNSCSDASYVTTDDKKQIITESRRRGFDAGKIRALELRNVRLGAIIRLYRNPKGPKGSKTDDQTHIKVKKSIDYYFLESLEPKNRERKSFVFEDDTVRIEYIRKKFLDGKVSFITID
ncbi:MAG: Vps62-related protein [FCB group bacterium]|nr:Vps62-related protein [FCB group bacterium]